MTRIAEEVFRALTGAYEWVQRRPWLRGGPHHAVLTMLGMAVGALWSVELLVALPFLGFYAFDWLEEHTTDNVTDFAFPLGAVLIWTLGTPWAALLAVALGAGTWWVLYKL